MPYAAEHKEETRARIVRSAARLFNRKGFAEVTIAEIMQAANLTHGGFYRHFSAKEELYAEAVRHFLCKSAPELWQKNHVDPCARGAELARMIADAYFSTDHQEDREGSCPLISLPSDVARGGEVVKAAYRYVIANMAEIFEAGLEGPNGRERALALVSLCVGSMVLARGVDDAKLAATIRRSAKTLVLETAGWQAKEARHNRRQTGHAPAR
jgi:TetR/AcrR family transcriptional regulator, transcriptional repressor for nem operon